MSEARAGPLARLMEGRRRERVWLIAALITALATLAALLALGVYRNNQVTSAAQAKNAQLAASRVNASEWEAIATGALTPRISSDVKRDMADLTRHVEATRSDPAAAAFTAYSSALQVEFQLLGQGQLAAARRYDVTNVDPAYDKLGSVLTREANESTRSAANARTFTIVAEVVAVSLGFLVFAALLRQVAMARRALAASEVEQRMLEETNKAKSDLISVVSHDLRTPLTSIVGYLEILADEQAGPVGDEQKRLLAVVQRNTGRLLTIVDDLLFVSRAEEHRIALAMSEMDLAAAAADAVEAQRWRAQECGVELKASAAAAPAIMGDPARVDELIENLVSNAVKFTPAGGSVRVSVASAGGRARLEVADTGVGIALDDQEHLFERFFRAPSVLGMPGTGLGLAIVKAIADAHHASVGVRSTIGEGSTFWVDFPPVPEFTGVALQPPDGCLPAPSAPASGRLAPR